MKFNRLVLERKLVLTFTHNTYSSQDGILIMFSYFDSWLGNCWSDKSHVAMHGTFSRMAPTYVDRCDDKK